MKSYLKKFARLFIGKKRALKDLDNVEHETVNLFGSETVETPETLDMHAFTYPGEVLLKGKAYETPELSISLIENVLYFPKENVLVTPSREIIAESLIIGEDSSLLRLKKLLNRPVETIPGYSCVFHSNRSGYYHTLIVEPPRLFLLNESKYKDLDEIKLLCPKAIQPFEKISIANLAPKNSKPFVVDENQVYHLEKALLPSFATKRSCGYLPKPYVDELKAKLLPQRPSLRNRRSLISRAKCSSTLSKGRGRHILNEDSLMDSLSKYGFKKYLLEDLSFEEQISLFYDSEIIVGSHGAGLANLVFADRASVLELHPRNIITPTFYYLCKSLNHNYKYWSAEIEAPHNRVDFEVDVEKISEMLSDWL